tara:strand:- start:14895 stop:15191 length:297 start_codon:yes stop_codon:yes gene_type:complete
MIPLFELENLEFESSFVQLYLEKFQSIVSDEENVFDSDESFKVINEEDLQNDKESHIWYTDDESEIEFLNHLMLTLMKEHNTEKVILVKSLDEALDIY